MTPRSRSPHRIHVLGSFLLLLSATLLTGLPTALAAAQQPRPPDSRADLSTARAAYHALAADSSRRRIEDAFAVISRVDSALSADSVGRVPRKVEDAAAARLILTLMAGRLAQALYREAERTRDCATARRAQEVARPGVAWIFICDRDCPAELGERCTALQRVNEAAPRLVRALCGG